MIDTIINIIFIVLILVCLIINAMGNTINEIYDVKKTFNNIDEAVQGVAADDKYFYAISNKSIGKYDRKTGKALLKWKSKENITHLNGGFIENDNLICFHNPKGKNSIETFNKNTLKKIQSTKINVDGSLTWYYPYDGTNYGVLAHYNDNAEKTRFCKFDDNFKVIKSWKFPKSVIRGVKPWSISGGFMKGGCIYVSGHDKSIIYKLKHSDNYDTLIILDKIDVSSSGQGMAFHNDDLFTINRKNKQVIQHIIRYDLE